MKRLKVWIHKEGVQCQELKIKVGYYLLTTMVSKRLECVYLLKH